MISFQRLVTQVLQAFLIVALFLLTSCSSTFVLPPNVSLPTQKLPAKIALIIPKKDLRGYHVTNVSAKCGGFEYSHASGYVDKINYKTPFTRQDGVIRANNYWWADEMLVEGLPYLLERVDVFESPVNIKNNNDYDFIIYPQVSIFTDYDKMQALNREIAFETKSYYGSVQGTPFTINATVEFALRMVNAKKGSLVKTYNGKANSEGNTTAVYCNNTDGDDFVLREDYYKHIRSAMKYAFGNLLNEVNTGMAPLVRAEAAEKKGSTFDSALTTELTNASSKSIEANEAFYKGDFQLALDKHREAFSIREKNNDKFSMATSAINIAANYYHLKNYPASKEWVTKAKELAESSRNNIVLGSSISLLAGFQIREGEFGEAIESYKKAIELFEESKEAYAKVKATFSDEELLAKFNTSRKQINDSMENLISHKLNSVFSLGIAYAFFGDYNTALENLKEFSASNGLSFIPPIMRESYKSVYEATLAYAEGCGLLAQDDHENALTKFKKAQELYIESMAKLDSAAGVVSSMKKIGDICLKQNREAEALDYYKQALEFSDKNAPALKEKYGLKKLVLDTAAVLEKTN